MRNLSNLGLEEMTEQEMRETKGGSWFWDFLKFYLENLYGEPLPTINEPENFHPGKCYCDTLGCEYCPSCIGGL